MQSLFFPNSHQGPQHLAYQRLQTYPTRLELSENVSMSFGHAYLMFLPSKHHHHRFRGHVFIHADNDVVKRLDIVVVVIVLVVFILLVLVVVGVGDVEDQLENEDDGGESG